MRGTALIHIWPNYCMNYDSCEQQNTLHLSETTIILKLSLHFWSVTSAATFRGPSLLSSSVYISDGICSWVWAWPQQAVASSLSKWLCLWGSCDLAPLGPDKRFGCLISPLHPASARKLDGMCLDAESYRGWRGLRARCAVCVWVFMFVWPPKHRPGPSELLLTINEGKLGIQVYFFQGNQSKLLKKTRCSFLT